MRHKHDAYQPTVSGTPSLKSPYIGTLLRDFSVCCPQSLADLQKLMRKGIVINEVTAYFRFEITSDFLHMTLNSYQGQNSGLVFST